MKIDLLLHLENRSTCWTLAKLEVVDDNPRLGAFLDWGLNKDLMLPNFQKETKVEIGKKYLVGLYEDSMVEYLLQWKYINS